MTFDVTDSKSFENMQNWVDSLNQHTSSGIPRILIGNKIDMTEERVVTQQSAEQLASQYGISYFETSAKLNQGVDQAMESIFQQTINHKFKLGQV